MNLKPENEKVFQFVVENTVKKGESRAKEEGRQVSTLEKGRVLGVLGVGRRGLILSETKK